MRLAFFFLVGLFLMPGRALAQPEGVLELGDPIHRFLLRQQAAGHLPAAHLVHLPLSAYDARALLDTLEARRPDLPPADRTLLDRYRGTPPALPGRLSGLYRDGWSLLSARGGDFALQADPLLYLSAGRASNGGALAPEARTTVWQNTRGVRVGGRIGAHVFFESRLEETQRREARYLPESTIPRTGYQRPRQAEQIYDEQLATGLVGVRTRHFEVRAGRDRHHWGPGLQSLFLSNYAAPYDHLQLRTSVWRLQYTNLFALFTDVSGLGARFPNQVLPRRYGAFHHLHFRATDRLQFEIFEGIVFAPDTTGRRAGFDASYLNPIIFYRAVEFDRGSPDNVLMGGGAAWRPVDGLRLYGQLLLDELRVGEIGRRWWGNKWGGLVGLETAGWPPGLWARLEYARLRPYLYSHRRAASAYLHFGDVLGHGAGPNAVDWSLALDYQVRPRWRLALQGAYTRRGRNTDLNYGGDARLPNRPRASDTDVRLLQGVRQTALLVEVHGGYELLPRLYLEGALRIASLDDAERGVDRYVAPYALLRWGIPFKSARF